MERQKEIKLVRFVDWNAAKYIIHPNSTFVLRSLKYYRDLEEVDGDDNRGDIFEARHECEDGSTRQIDMNLVSCWCMCTNMNNMDQYWKLFDNSVLAIFSTNNKLRSMLERCVQDAFGKEKHIEDKRVKYYGNKMPLYNDPIKWVFNKRNRRKANGTSFRDENEYRFSILCVSLIVQTIILYVDPKEYVDEIYINPSLNKNKWQEIKNLFFENVNCPYGVWQGFDWKNKIVNFNEMEKQAEPH